MTNKTPTSSDNAPIEVRPSLCVTRLAYACQVAGVLALVSGLVAFIPDPSGVDLGFFGSTSMNLILSCLGLIVLLPFTLLMAIAATLRIRFSRARFRGHLHIWIGLGAAFLGWAVPFVWFEYIRGYW